MRKVKLGEVCTAQSSNLLQRGLEKNNGNYPIYGASGLIKTVDFYKQEKPYIGIIKDGAGVGRVMCLPAKSSVIGTMQYILPNEKININYLYYVLVCADLGKKFTGATIPHIYFKDYKKLEFNLPPLADQQRIAIELDMVYSAIAKQKEQLKLCDALIKSKFNEMFGDPEQNDKKWDSLSWDELFNTTTGKLDSNAMVKGGEFPFFTCAKEAFRINKYAFDCEALLLAGNNAAGIYDVKHYSGKFNAYQRTYVITLKDKSNSYLPFKIMLELKLERMKELSKGTNTRYLTMEILKAFAFILPPKPLQQQFATFVTKVEQNKTKIKQSLGETETLYKALMQKYFGGEHE